MMIGRNTVVLLVAMTLATLAGAAELKTDKQKFSYAIGFQIGQSVKREAGEVDLKVMQEAIEDVVKDRPPQLPVADMQEAFNKRREEQMAKMKKAGESSQKAGEEYLAVNKKKAGVTVTKSGLQYRVIKKGNGPKPAANATVTVHYSGKLIDGTEFDSSIKRGTPATFGLGQVIKGWQEGLQLMSKGAKYELVIPSDIAYGPQGRPPVIPPNAVLVFEVELLEIR